MRKQWHSNVSNNDVYKYAMLTYISVNGEKHALQTDLTFLL